MRRTPTPESAPWPAPHSADLPAGLQVLSMLLLAAFAIVATVLAFVHFPPGGFVLALIFAWRGFGPLQFRRPKGEQMAEPETTGNAAFDAYRRDTLERLNDERQSFEAFLGRLRAAKDQTEFDRFLDDRARMAAIPA